MYKQKTVTITCPNCGQTRTVPESDMRVHADWEDGGYCSEECSKASRGDYHRILWNVGKWVENLWKWRG